MEKINRLTKILGFANRARKLTLGMSATQKGLQRGKIYLVILAEDLSPNAAMKIHELTEPLNIAVFPCSTKNELGKLFGRNEVGIVGVGDTQFAKSIREIMA
ncbi:MAG: L7Ae/L30e/S12e/Gadd45 family ribosomal protein [bacterium]